MVKREFLISASTANFGAVDTNLRLLEREESSVPAISSGFDGVEPFRGKSGCVSFYGLTHQSVEEGRLVPAPFREGKGSFLWVLGPAVLISSLIVPQYFLGSTIEAFFQDPVPTGIYDIYQLTKATHFIEKMMFSMSGLPKSAQLLERYNALVAMIVTFQVLGVICLWSLLTFLLRLFPSRPIVENY